MRLFLTFGFVAFLWINSLAQSVEPGTRPVTYAASSEWQNVTLKPVGKPRSNQPVRSSGAPNRDASPTPAGADFQPAFTGDFATNRNGWKAGAKGDYYYQIGMGRYSIQKRRSSTRQVAFSTVPLPTNINLNRADVFTIKVDILADSGRIPTGGLLFGVKDSLNYSAFTLNNRGEVSLIQIANGEAVSDYMALGTFIAPGVPVDKNRNRLTIRRKRNGLHIYINDQEIRSSPYLFRALLGNGIGMTTSAYWTSFQKLSVTLGP